MAIPSTKDIRDFIAQSPTPPTAKDIAAAFGVSRNEKGALRHILKQMVDQGQLIRNPDKSYHLGSDLPSVMTLEVTGTDTDGELYARPTGWDERKQGPAPQILIPPAKKGHPPYAAGVRLLAHIDRADDNNYQARVIRLLDTAVKRTIGTVIRTKRGYEIQPSDKKSRNNFSLATRDLNGAKEGDLVAVSIREERGHKIPSARVVQVLGHRDDPKAISLISIHEAGLREEFSQAALDETKNMTVPALGDREDLRQIPLVTIDGPDARDFDDAVFAEPTKDGGFHLIVAIADVAHYVTPGSALDNDAYSRGNSTYFPDRVVPMLPEKLSNDLCSLRPHENRACVGFHLWIDRDGNLSRYQPFRGLMKSVARLTYEQAQAARDGNPDTVTAPLMGNVINPLYAAYAVLAKARDKRGALDLDMPERKIIVDAKGTMTGVKKAERLDSHKLIEEFMILANVAAASALEDKKAPCVYRVHETPDQAKLEEARNFVAAFGFSLPPGNITSPIELNKVLKKVAGHPASPVISDVLLRTQRQAHYHTKNEGHFGLALERYGHFTSPIRRYADLLVHRSLIEAFNLGNGGLDKGQKAKLQEMAEHISGTERVSVTAERNAVDRFTAAYLSQYVGAEFSGRIRGITRSGLFVALDDTGADGFIPARLLPSDNYYHDEHTHALIGRRSGRVYRLGASLVVRLKEADGLSGNTIFETANDKSADIAGASFPKTPLPKQRNDGGGYAGRGGKFGKGRGKSGRRGPRPR